jgi:hypothetical protein
MIAAVRRSALPSHSVTTYRTDDPSMTHPGWTSWSLDPALLGVIALAAWAYSHACRRARRLGPTFCPRYADAPRVYGISAIRDQPIAGAAMCLLEFLIFGIALAVVFVDMLGRDEHSAERAEAILPTLRRTT